MQHTSEQSGEATLLGDEGPSVSGRRKGPEAFVLQRGDGVGRYIVLDRLGAGGMGVVYRAIDPELGRRVAIKLLRFGDGPRDPHDRLLREAQAMARVRHPNVVAVYDVGTQDDRVYVAMELVEGQTLRAWLGAQRPAWPGIVEAFVQAGRGLAAAHREHLVHRDFKPDNVMIDGEGRVVVMDFGLARGEEAEGSLPVAPEASINDLLSTELTRVGALVGTPPYMSPEQLQGGEVGPASDQFAFCVSLYEALYGRRPFEADHVMGLVLAITKGEVRAPPAAARVPAWLHRVILRGLRLDPAERWSSMDELAATLANPPQRRRRQWLIRAGTLLAVAGAAAGAAAWWSVGDERCTGAAAQLEGLWDGSRQAEVDQALAGLGLPWIEPVRARVRTDLDAYAHEWTTMHTEACRATVVLGSQSQEAMDLRMACLERARVDLRAVVDQLAHADAEVALHAHRLPRGLPSLSACADLAGLRAEVPPPKDEATREGVEKAREELARARSAERAGKYEDAAGRLEGVAAVLDALDYVPLRIEHELAMARVEMNRGHIEPAGEHGQGALALALAHDQPRGALDAVLILTEVHSEGLRRPGEAQVFASIAIGLSEREGVEARARSAAYNAQGLAQAAAGEPSRAEAAYRQAIALVPADDPLRAAMLLNNLGNALADAGRHDQAQVELERAYELTVDMLGPEHPVLITLLNSMGTNLYRIRRLEEAEGYQRRAVALAIASHGELHPSVAMGHVNLSSVLSTRGKHAEARDEMLAALAVVEATMGADHPRAGLIHGNLATVQHLLGEPAEAETHARRALAILEATVGPDHRDTAVPRSVLGLVLADLGRYDEAEAQQLRALALREATLPPDHDQVLLSLLRLGQVRTSAGRPADAIEPLERCVAGLEAKPDVTERARGHLALAEALWQVDRDRARAVAMVQRSLDELPPDDEEREAATTWLSAHRLAGVPSTGP